MSDIVKIFYSKEKGVTPFCEFHAGEEGIALTKFIDAPSTGMGCCRCAAQETVGLPDHSHLTNEAYNAYIKGIGRRLGGCVDDKQKVFLAKAMETFWPQMFLWGLFYAGVSEDDAVVKLRHILWDQEATQPLWDTIYGESSK